MSDHTGNSTSPGSTKGSKTYLTGVRSINWEGRSYGKNNKDHDDVFISGFYDPSSASASDTAQGSTAFVYRGDLKGKGMWHPLNYPGKKYSLRASTDRITSGLQTKTMDQSES